MTLRQSVDIAWAETSVSKWNCPWHRGWSHLRQCHLQWWAPGLCNVIWYVALEYPFQVSVHLNWCGFLDCKPMEAPRPAVIRPTVNRMVCRCTWHGFCFCFGRNLGSNGSRIKWVADQPAVRSIVNKPQEIMCPGSGGEELKCIKLG